MNIGIIGLTAAGKTTLFASFTAKSDGREGAKGTMGIVPIPDERVEKLSALYKPKKTVYGTVNFEDCPALDTQSKQDRIRLLDRMKVMDAFIVVSGAYRDQGAGETADEAMKARFEVVITDLDFVTKRIERLERDMQLSPKNRDVKEKEMALLQRLVATLEGERLVSSLEFNDMEQGFLSSYGLLTMKPACFVVNVSESIDGATSTAMREQLEGRLREKGDGSPVLVINALLEAEIASLDGDEAGLFMQEYGISEPGRDRVITTAYNLLSLITFYTVGDDECRAWTIPRGGSALDAAGAIHSDLAKGFIRAEVVENDTLLALGSLGEARKAGKLRLEGKTYTVRDGEIVHVMFNV